MSPSGDAFKDDETIPDGEEELPTDVGIGMAVDVDSADVFRHLDFFLRIKVWITMPNLFWASLDIL